MTAFLPPGEVYAYLAADHDHLDGLLVRAARDPAVIDRAAYDAFRAGLLRHIAMEEKVLLPAARRARGDVPLPIAKRLRSDHAVLGALLVPSPTHAIAAAIADILATHNPLEEGPDGVYATCEALVASAGSGAASVAELCARLRAVAEVPVAAYRDTPQVHLHVERLLRERRG